MYSRSPMDVALGEARVAAGRGEVPVGAVLVSGDRILACSSNRVEETGDPTAHAEMLVLRKGAALVGRPGLRTCDLYVTLEPCAMCAAAIAIARIPRLYFGAWDEKGGGVEHGARVFEQPGLPSRPEVYVGVAERDSAELLRAFFVRLRT